MKSSNTPKNKTSAHNSKFTLLFPLCQVLKWLLKMFIIYQIINSHCPSKCRERGVIPVFKKQKNESRKKPTHYFLSGLALTVTAARVTLISNIPIVL